MLKSPTIIAATLDVVGKLYCLPSELRFPISHILTSCISDSLNLSLAILKYLTKELH
jgi:hypothetical protein